VATPIPLTAYRSPVDLSHIEVEVSLITESQFFAGLNGDIASGGLFVQTYEMRPVGSRVVLALSLPTGELRATGVVSWVRQVASGAPPGLGIAFDDLPEKEREAIEEFCRTRPALYHELDSD
jgi:uncharacterized protein (TIGR02266 family)